MQDKWISFIGEETEKSIIVAEMKRNEQRNAYAAARAYAEQYLHPAQHAIFGIDLDNFKVRHDVSTIHTSDFYLFFACYEHVCVEGINDIKLIVRLLNEQSL